MRKYIRHGGRARGVIRALDWESFEVGRGKLLPVMSVLNNGPPAANIDPYVTRRTYFSSVAHRDRVHLFTPAGVGPDALIKPTYA